MRLQARCITILTGPCTPPTPGFEVCAELGRWVPQLGAQRACHRMSYTFDQNRDGRERERERDRQGAGVQKRAS